MKAGEEERLWPLAATGAGPGMRRLQSYVLTNGLESRYVFPRIPKGPKYVQLCITNVSTITMFVSSTP